MTPTILLIHNDEKTQAEVVAVLRAFPLKLKTITSGKNLPKALKAYKPELVICSSTVDDIEPFAVAEDIKDSAKFLLLCPKKEATNTIKQAKKSDITDVLPEPFTAKQLTKAVIGILGDSMVAVDQMPLLLFLEDELLKQSLTRLLEKAAIEFELCETQKELEASAAQSTFAATVVQWDAVSDRDSLVSSATGTLIAILEENESAAVVGPHDDLVTLNRPLSCQELVTALRPVAPISIEGPLLETLASDTQTNLAAQICGALFARFLSEDALSARNWEKAGTIASQEVLRVCETFEKQNKLQ